MGGAIEVRGLEKRYGDHLVLRGLDFSVGQGEVFALLGSNGAGKTTALECIEGFRNYDGGAVTIRGRMGIQFQSAALPEHIKAREAVRLFAKWNRAPADPATLDALGIPAFADAQYRQLSTGQKRRLHLALALIREPDILFLDEPSAGLDVEGRLALHGLIRRWKEAGKTIVLASHDMAEVEALCDRLAILSGGRIAFIGTVAQLNRAVGTRYRITIRTASGTETHAAEDIGETLLSLLAGYKEKGERVLDVQVDRGSLEQHVMQISKGA